MRENKGTMEGSMKADTFDSVSQRKKKNKKEKK